MITVADDAKLVSTHAKKKVIDVEDIRLAAQMYEEKSCTPPSRNVLLESSIIKNSTPLPTPKTTSVLRLPPDRFCLTGNIFRYPAW